MSNIIINSKVMPPCKDCPNRKLGCHSVCPKFKTYEYEKLAEEVERVRQHEGNRQVVVRLSAVIW